MKVIENNYKDEPKEFDMVCPHCNSKLAFTDEDICSWDIPKSELWLYCGACGRQFFITDKDDEPTWSCEWCGETFSGEPYIGVHGAEWVDCPKCGERTFVSEGIEITADTVEYPKHFYTYGKGKSISDERINEWIKDAVNALDKDVDYSGHASGDTIVLAYKSDEDYSSATVIVAKKYSECEVKIPKEKF